MGNSAIITTPLRNIGVYLHWNGGRDSVEAFLEYCSLRGFRSFEDDYGIARFTQVVANYFGGDLSIGVFNGYIADKEAEYMDNGIYVVEGWKIVDRVYDGNEQNYYDMDKMLLDIDEAQPPKDQLGKQFLNSPKRPVTDIDIGDTVYVRDFSSNFHKCVVIGIGGEDLVNGTDVKGIPYTDMYGAVGYEWNNINNYLLESEYRVVEPVEGANG